ncbi:MAG: hypothetical protein JXR56_09000 [Candidatus Cloacimonetes bacterium]|nr:hypothetical protein [Candidatus Cloacimonadota bacterium]
MHKFQELVRSFRKHHNKLIGIRYLLLALLSIVWAFLMFFTAYELLPARGMPMFLYSLTLRICSALVILYLFYEGKNKLLDDNNAARLLDILNNDKNETYQNAIELLTNEKGYNPNILELIFTGADDIANKQIKHKLPLFNPIQKKLAVYGFLGAALILLLNIPKLPDSWNAFYTDKLLKQQHKTTMTVEPGNVRIPRHSNLTIRVTDPEVSTDYQLYYRLDKQWKQVEMSDFEADFTDLDFNFEYYVRNKYAISDTFTVSILEKPGVRNLEVKYFYPEYSGLQTYIDSLSTGQIRALKNTRVKLSFESTSRLKSAIMAFRSGKFLNMQPVDSLNFYTTFVIERNDSWHLNLKDFLDQETIDIEREIIMLSDEAPRIEITYPAKDTLLNQTMLQRVRALASDDFGLKNLRLHFRIEDREPQTRIIKEVISGSLFEAEYPFDLTGMDLFPGNRVEYWLSIQDNCPETNTTESAHLFLRLPSIEEIYREIEEKENEKREELSDVLKQSKELTKEFEEKRREMLKKEEPEWDDKEEIKQFMQEQKEIKEDVNKVAEEYQELIEKVQENEALSAETIDKMERIQELMQELDNEQMQEAMKKMQDAMEKLDPEVLKKAMKDFKFSMDDFNEKLEMTIELLESIKKEQQLQKALDIAEQMEKLQEQLEKKTQDPNSDNMQLAEEQKKIKEQLENLQKELDKLSEMLNPEKDKEVAEMLKELKEMQEMQELMQEMSNSEQHLQQNNRSEAQQSQKSAQQKMEMMRKMLMEMKKSMGGGSAGEMGAAFSECIRKMLFFSQMHEQQTNIFEGDPYLILQSELAIYEGITIAVNTMFKTPLLSMFITPKFYYDMNFLDTSFREMFTEINEARSYKVKNYLSDITKGINLVIYDLMLTQASSQSGSSGGSGMESLMQMMQQMGQQQMAMNMLTQQLMQQMQQGNRGMSNELRQQIQKLASEEQRLADNLKRALQNNPEAQKQMGTMDNLINELESIAKELRGNRLTADTLKKQERILSRMLDIQKSINKREFSRKRKAENSEFEDWDTPESIKYKFNEMRNKALLKKDYKEFPPEYQEIIKEYLRLLNEKTDEE